MDQIILDTGIYENIIDEFVSLKEFVEYSHTLSQLRRIQESTMFIEAVVDAPNTRRKQIGKIVQNTKSTTRDVEFAYNGITDAKGAYYKLQWDATFSVINLAVKAITWLLKKISNIPKMIIAIIDRIAKIPSDIKTKIKGDIQLYITINDIEQLYNYSLLNRLDTFISIVAALSNGELWTAFFKDNPNPIKKVGAAFNNDMKRCKELKAIYNKIENIKFEKTIIDLSKKENVDIYFNAANAINFTDLHGNKHNTSYYKSLEQLIKDISGRKKELEKVQQDFSKKYSKSQVNQDFANLTVTQQAAIEEAIREISVVVRIVGDIVKYIMTDINTIDKSVNTILKKNLKK